MKLKLQFLTNDWRKTKELLLQKALSTEYKMNLVIGYDGSSKTFSLENFA
jgi:hypothetical protein